MVNLKTSKERLHVIKSSTALPASNIFNFVCNLWQCKRCIFNQYLRILCVDWWHIGTAYNGHQFQHQCRHLLHYFVWYMYSKRGNTYQYFP